LATDDGKRFKNDRRPRGTAPKFTFHDLRHAGISLMIEQGMPVLEVCKIAGHANANITLSIYAHLFNDKSTALGTVTKISDSLLPMQHQRNKALPSY
jgi:integrase